MILRTKNGETVTVARNGLLHFLGVEKGFEGVQKVAGDVELIAAVPIAMTEGGEFESGYPWTLSTYDLDRHGERIDPMGWEYESYMQNPVVEWAHRYDIPAIGKIEGLAIDGQGLHGIVKFNEKDFDPFGWSIGERVKAGVIRAGSVGFRVIEIEIPPARDGDETALIFRKQELLEFSICNVPANPYALAKMAGGENKTLSRNWGFPHFGEISSTGIQERKRWTSL